MRICGMKMIVRRAEQYPGYIICGRKGCPVIDVQQIARFVYGDDVRTFWGLQMKRACRFCIKNGHDKSPLTKVSYVHGIFV